MGLGSERGSVTHSMEFKHRKRRQLLVAPESIQSLALLAQQTGEEPLDRDPGGQKNKERGLPLAEHELDAISMAQVFLRAQVINMRRLFQPGFELDRLLKRFVTASLFQLFAHLVIDIAFKRYQPAIANPEAVNASARKGREADFGFNGLQLVTNPACPTRSRGPKAVEGIIDTVILEKIWSCAIAIGGTD